MGDCGINDLLKAFLSLYLFIKHTKRYIFEVNYYSFFIIKHDFISFDAKDKLFLSSEPFCLSHADIREI